jgi:HEAT repeat protein
VQSSRIVGALLVAFTCAQPAHADPKLYEGRALDDWINDLRLVGDESPASRARAIAVLGRIGKPAVERLLARSPKLRPLACARALATIGPPALPALIEALDDEGDLTRMQRAAEALGEMGPPARAAVPGLARAADHPDMWIRIAALDALGQIGPAARGAISIVRTRLYDPWVRVPISAAEALYRITGDASEPVAALRRTLRDVDESIRDTALLALGRIGPEPEVIATLIESLDDVAEPPRRTARQVLGGFGTHALRELIRALSASSTAKRTGAALALSRLGPKASPAVNALTQLFAKSQPPPVRDAAAYALGEIGAAARPAVPALIAALMQNDRVARAAAIPALGRIGHAEAVEPLAELLECDETPVRVLSAEALGRFGPAAAPAVPALTDALTDASPAVRRWAAEALGRIGPKATSALDALRRLLNDRQTSVVDAAQAAILRLKSP